MADKDCSEAETRGLLVSSLIASPAAVILAIAVLAAAVALIRAWNDTR
jgi:hypothetical protein